MSRPHAKEAVANPPERHRPFRLGAVGLVFIVAVAAAAGPNVGAQPRVDADWPCAQRLVPELTAATYWNGPPPPKDAGGNWRNDPKLGPLVASVASRDMPVDEAAAKLAAFADSLPPEQRRAVIPELFAASVEAVNTERHDVIVRLRALARRQRSVAELVDKVTAELRAAPAEAGEPDGSKRAEIEQRREFLIRTFQQTQRTIQYACQVPTELEARLGAFARTLAAKL